MKSPYRPWGCLKGLKKDSYQGDAVVASLYEKFGVRTDFEEEGVRLTKINVTIPKSFNYNFQDCPDIAQTVAVTCATLNINAHLKGLETLRIKETDRVLALKTELNKQGYFAEIEGNDLLILAKKNQVEGVPVTTYDDHRMAMAFASIAFQREVYIDDEEVVTKSYPNFWEDLKKVGVKIS